MVRYYKDLDLVSGWRFHPPFSITAPGATMFIGTLCIVHSLCHIPHLLMYRRMGMFTAFWSLAGLGLIFGVVLEDEWLYDIWIWYSCVYLPVMLIVMYLVLTAAIWALDIQPLRAVFAVIAILFYLFMFYCVVYVMSEKRQKWTTTPHSVYTTRTCPYCPNCTTERCPRPTNATTTTTKKKRMLRLLERLGVRA